MCLTGNHTGSEAMEVGMAGGLAMSTRMSLPIAMKPPTLTNSRVATQFSPEIARSSETAGMMGATLSTALALPRVVSGSDYRAVLYSSGSCFVWVCFLYVDGSRCNSMIFD